jgi:hypothetical protein
MEGSCINVGHGIMESAKTLGFRVDQYFVFAKRKESTKL